MAAVQITLTRNQRAQDAVVAAGTAVGTDTIRVNFDPTNMTRSEAVLALEQVKELVLEGKWPIL